MIRFIETIVVNIHHGASYDVLIDRSTPLGNPFRLGVHGDRVTVLSRHRTYLYERVERDLEFRRLVLNLRGKKLGCHCAPKLCHGMNYVEWLETHFE